MFHILKGDDVWLPENPGGDFAIFVMQGEAAVHCPGGAVFMHMCSGALWRQHGINKVELFEGLAIVAELPRDSASGTEPGKVFDLPPICCEVIEDAFFSDNHVAGHQSAAIGYALSRSSTTETGKDKEDAPACDTPGGPDGFAREVLDYMDKHLSDPLSIEHLSEVFECGQARLAAAFQKAGLLTPMKELASRRIERAKKILTQSEMPVVQIGISVGFPNQSSFTHFFKRHTGISPREFRSNCRWLL